MRVDSWLKDKFGAKLKGSEANFECPKCKHQSFYFNIHKKVGVCFRAGCGWTPTLKELQEYVQAGNLQFQDSLIWQEPERKVIELPQDSRLIIDSVENNQIKFNDRQALDYLMNRNIPPLLIYRYRIHSNYERVILPVYNNGVLVSYVARHFRGDSNGMRYLYPSGARHSETFLGWIECKQWERITLIENSFVSLALRDLNVTTNFGSNLGESQIEKLVNSKIKSVVLLWDAGAEPKADKAVQKLRRLGIPSALVRINGQPDNYPKQRIKEIIDLAHSYTQTNNYIMDARK